MEKFNIEEAEQLQLTYAKRRNYTRVLFLSELIQYQYFFGEKSIIGVQLSLVNHYKRKTVLESLNDLGYTLVEYSSPICRGSSGQICGRSTNVLFTK